MEGVCCLFNFAGSFLCKLIGKKVMQADLKKILDVQELDIKMIHLMRLKKQRNKELQQIGRLRSELQKQLDDKQGAIELLDEDIKSRDQKLAQLDDKLKRLEGQQMSIKKVEEFNAMTQEITATEREKNHLKQQILVISEKKSHEEEVLEKILASFEESKINSKDLEDEIHSNIAKIDQEGSTLKSQRQELAKTAEPHILSIYERLLRNKKDRVLVPVENRTCSGCHIALTIQHENLVRKGENIVFCEHCSRMHYWPESEVVEGTSVATKKRRRRTVTT